MAKKSDGVDVPAKGSNQPILKDLSDGAVRTISAIACFAIALLSLFASFGMAGWGNAIFSFLEKMFGIGYFLIPIIFAILGITYLRGVEHRMETTKIVGSVLFFLSSLGIIYLISDRAAGVVGGFLAKPLIQLVDVYAATTLLVAVFIISLVMIFEWEFSLSTFRLFKKKTADSLDELDESRDEDKNVDEADGEEEKRAEREAEAKYEPKIVTPKTDNSKKNSQMFDEDAEYGLLSKNTLPRMMPFTPPPLSILERDKGKPETGDIKANANIIKRTLQNFGISVEMDEISIGPSVTRYALKPAEGVKLSKIVALNNDLALALAAHPIRIEAPIPGKSLVGIEVPNTAKTTVGLGTLLSSSDYQESEKPLLTSLGKDIAGKAHFSNLAKAPHMLIAGATGSGKSVTIHALITSLLYRNSPENLRFIMIDPKRVELTLYNKIPHLLTPVITDPKKAILALKWAAKEMARRYDILEKAAARDIESYHKNVLSPALEAHKKRLEEAEVDEQNQELPEGMHYIVIVIDELADIMQTYPRELESAIVRLAQMSRAVGIHLVISTQRPSVNVITGLIKANIPTRIALQVASQIDSRTILDQAGAEKLLGAGDMLYLGGEMSKPIRLQSAYISEAEVKQLVKYLADQYKDEILSELNLNMTEAGSSAAFDAITDGESFDDDEMYEPAKEAVLSAGKASTSYIQRKLGIGYSRAAKLMDMLYERGIIGPANGSKPREVISTGSGVPNPVPNDQEGNNI